MQLSGCFQFSCRLWSLVILPLCAISLSHAQTFTNGTLPSTSYSAEVIIDAGSGSVSLGNNTTFSGKLILRSGKLDLGAYKITISGELVVEAGWFKGGSAADMEIKYSGTTTLPYIENGLEKFKTNASGVTVVLDADLIVRNDFELKAGTLNVASSQLTLTGKPGRDHDVNNLITTDQSRLVVGPLSGSLLLKGGTQVMKSLVLDGSGSQIVKWSANASITVDTLRLVAGTIGDNNTVQITVNHSRMQSPASPTNSTTVNASNITLLEYYYPTNTIDLTHTWPANVKLDGGATYRLTTNRALQGNLTIANGTTLSLNGMSLAVAGTLVTSGGIPSGSLTYEGLEYRGAATIGNETWPSTLTINSGSSVLTMSSSRTYSGNLVLQSGTLAIGGSPQQPNTLTLEGSVAGSGGAISGGVNSNLVISGTSGAVTLPTIDALRTLTINRTAGASLSSNVLIDQALELTAGDLNIGDNVITLKGAITGPGQVTGSGRVHVLKAGKGKRTLGGGARVQNLELDDDEDFELNGTLSVTGDLTMTDGDLQLGASTLDLGTTGQIIGESAGRKIIGSTGSKIRSTRSVASNSSVNFGNGVTINAGANNLGPTVIADRTFDVALANSVSSIPRRYVFSGLGTPTTNMSVVFAYGEDELNGVVNDESRLGVFASTNDGASWYEPISQVRDVNNNTITVTFTSNFSKASRLPSFGKGAGIASTQDTPPLILTGGEAGGALPVELVSFSGMMRNEMVQLAWKTATETNNYGFEVGRAAVADPKASVENAQWNTIGFVAGNGTTSSERSYSFSDDVSAGALRQVSHFAYRLRQIDRDGTTDYSPVVFVSRSAQEPVALALDVPYPNPTSSESYATVRLAESRIATVQLVSVDGKVLETIAADQQLDAGVHNFRISRGTLPAGVYFVVVQSADLRVVRPLTIVR